jgi:diguanylate cyclase (GGDEF)-like protein
VTLDEPGLHAGGRPRPSLDLASGIAARLDTGRRERMLTVICLTAAAAHLVVIIVQALLHRLQMGPLATRLAMDVVLVTAPLIRRWTGSLHVASLFVGVAVAVGLPAIALQTGGLTSPMIVTIPLVPLFMSAFVGRTGTVFVGAALLVGLAVVAASGGPGSFDVPGARVDLGPRGTILGACVALASVGAYLHERARGGLEDALRALAARLEDESTHDALTRLFNRRYLDERLAAEMSFARRHGTDLSVVLFDVDHFKQVNDRHGHGVGDDVLTEVGSRLQHCLRVEDVAARFGGEEFVALLRTTDLAAAHVVAERVRRVIEATAVRLPAVSIPITVSAGCASLVQSVATTPRALLEAADAGLYAAKRSGRNRVMSAEPKDPDLAA